MQTKEAINTIPIQKFIQQVKVADAGNHREIKMSIQEAKNLMYSMNTVIANTTCLPTWVGTTPSEIQ